MKRQKLSAGKKLLVLFLSIFLVFATINLVWLFGIELRYNKYCNKLEKTEILGSVSYQKIIGDYIYSVNKPKYMDFTGYLTVGDKNGSFITVDADGEIIDDSGLYIELNIIPNVLGQYRYRLWFYDEANGLDAFIFIDDNFNYIPSERATEEMKAATSKLVEDNLNEIKSLRNSAEALWDL